MHLGIHPRQLIAMEFSESSVITICASLQPGDRDMPRHRPLDTSRPRQLKVNWKPSQPNHSDPAAIALVLERK
jgi:hypothetical protein